MAPELENQEYRELARILEENKDLFATDPKKPGRTSMCEHSIVSRLATLRLLRKEQGGCHLSGR